MFQRLNLDRKQINADFEPVYSLKGTMHQNKFRKLMRQALDVIGGEVEETLPSDLLAKYKLLPINEALEGVHFPVDADHSKQARRRFVYEELLQFQLRIQALRKVHKENEQGTSIHYDLQKLKEFISTFPLN